MLTNQYPYEPATYYNLAICYIQSGKYQESLQMCDKAISYAGRDMDLISDIYKLKGICLFRLDKPIESIKAFNASKRYF